MPWRRAPPGHSELDTETRKIEDLSLGAGCCGSPPQTGARSGSETRLKFAGGSAPCTGTHAGLVAVARISYTQAEDSDVAVPGNDGARLVAWIPSPGMQAAGVSVVSEPGGPDVPQSESRDRPNLGAAPHPSA